MTGPGFGLAMVFVLYAYGGWNDAAFVAAEVRQPNRNLPRALLAGIAGITIIYLIVNAAYLSVLGFDAARMTSTPAADVLQQAVGPWGARAISVLVMISALGAINGMILTGSRVYATMGADHPLFAWLGQWNHRNRRTGDRPDRPGSVFLAVDPGRGDAGRPRCDRRLADGVPHRRPAMGQVLWWIRDSRRRNSCRCSGVSFC